MIAAPGGTTHFKITSAGAEVDFETKRCFFNSQTILPWFNLTLIINQINNITPESTNHCSSFRVNFFKLMEAYPLKNGSFNPLALVRVSGL
jgi:hypothetical protein